MEKVSWLSDLGSVGFGERNQEFRRWAIGLLLLVTFLEFSARCTCCGPRTDISRVSAITFLVE